MAGLDHWFLGHTPGQRHHLLWPIVWFICGLANGLFAQSGDTAPAWQAMRVYVPEEQVTSIVPRDYLTIDIDDLERLLAEESRRRAKSSAQATGIQRAFYMARWNEQTLSSDVSMWELSLPGNSQPLTVGRVSVAIDDPLIAASDRDFLTRHLRYVDDTRLQIFGTGTAQTMWFGFKTKTRRGEAGQHSVDLALPKAGLATMLVAVPVNAVVKANVPCARTDDPNKFLPSDWPQGAIVPSATEHWYVVHMSGRELCSLSFTPVAKANQFPYRTSVAAALCDMVVQPSGLETKSRFQLTKAPESNTLRLRIEEPLHIRKMQINGIDTSHWRSIAEAPVSEKMQQSRDGGAVATTARTRLIEVTTDDAPDGPLLLAVEAVARLPLPFDGPLPRLEIADSFVLDGRGSLSGAENVRIEDVQCQAEHLTTTSAAGNASWQWQWAGKPPAVSTRLRSATNQWSVRSLARFNVQTDVIVATAHVQLSSTSVQSNQVALELAEGWIVDSVELENAPTGVTANIRETDARGAELCVRWEEPRRDLDVRIAINAHYPQRTEVDNLRLQPTRIVALPGADQIDTYVIEPSGRFQVEIDPELLRLRLREGELLAWQRELLPRLADVWIFRGTRDSVPPIRLRRIRSTLNATLHTIVNRNDKETLVSYRVLCQPISGSIDQLRLMLPIPPHVVAPTWSLVAAPDGSYPRGLLVNSPATSSSTGETTFVIELSQSMAQQFQIEAELRLVGQQRLDAIPLPSMPQAVTQDAVVVVPESLVLPDNLGGLEILPSGMCCAQGSLIEAPALDAAEVTAARYDPNMVSHLHLQQPSETTSGAWIRQSHHEHWHHSGGQSLHRTSWDIVLPVSRVLEITLPADWDFESLSVDGLPLEVERENRQLRVVLAESNSVLVDLECSSPTKSGWWGRMKFEEPVTTLPVLAARRIAWFPGTVVADKSWPSPKNVAWADRLTPAAWWRWLSIDPWHDLISGRPGSSQAQLALDSHPVLDGLSDAKPLRGNWWPLELDPMPSSRSVWYVERSLLSTLMLAVSLGLGAAIYCSCGLQLLRWWITFTTVALLVCLAPEFLLLPVQLVALALGGAALVRASFVVMARSRPKPKTKETYPSSMAAIIPRSTSTLVLAAVCFAAPACTALAQPLSTSEDRVREEIFGILIPIDSDFQMAGDYVYVPTRLSRLLSNSNQTEAANPVVAVQAAFYSLRVSNDPVTLASSVGELTAELTIQASRADAELRLPYQGRDLQLQRAFLDSQEIYEGQRLKHDADQLTWRATDADRHTLRLVFRPRMIVEREGRGSLSVGIPAIPTAKLEVMGDDLRDVTVEAVGGMQLESPRFLTAQLGPANRLTLSWPTVINRSLAVQVQSDTWIHTRGDHLVAQCQLRVRGATALPRILHVVGDNSWQPVGQDWEDCRLLSADGASASGRPVYSVERSIDASSDALTIRALFLMRVDVSPQNVSIPFLALQEAAPQQRSLAISHADTPLWKPAGTETWQPLLGGQAATIWDKARLEEQPTLLRVPTGMVVATLQRALPPVAQIADETTEISLQSPEIKIKFAARWQQPLVGESAIRLHVPSSLRVDGAFVDALPARHSSVRVAGKAGAATNEVIIFLDAARGGVQSVNLQLSAPTRLNRTFRLPRPLLLNAKIGSSVVQVFRGAELSSELTTVDDADILLEKAEVRPSPLLDNLHALIGQAELVDRYRDSPELPIEVRLARLSARRSAQAVTRLTRSDQGWNAQVDVLVDDPKGNANHVFFDLPSGLAAKFLEPLDANVPMMRWPSADTNRSILCVLPQLDADGKALITIKIRLPSAGASQSITVPDIRLLGLSITRPVLALPKAIAGEEVRWTHVGRPLPENWLDSHALDFLKLDEYELHEASVSQFQAMWHASQTEAQAARLLLTRLKIKSSADNCYNGELEYWIDPRNQPYLTTKVPTGCELIGAQLGRQSIAWTEVDRDNIRFLLQPSYLPVQLTLFLRWSGQPRGTSMNYTYELPLPELDARDAGVTVVGLPRTSSLAKAGATYSLANATELSLAQAEDVVSKAWVNTLVQAAATAAGRQREELTAWWPAWEPTAIGLNELTVVVPKQFLPSELGGGVNGTNGSGTADTESFWKEYLGQILHRDASDLAAAADVHMSKGDSTKWFRLNATHRHAPLRMHEKSHSHAPLSVAQLAAAACALLLAGTLWSIPWSGLKTRLVGLEEYVWPLWIGLAVAMWSFLPVSWPAVVVAICGMIVLWRRFRELKRDRQFVLLPRAAR